MGIAQRINGNTCQKVEIAFAVGVINHAALAMGKGQRITAKYRKVIFICLFSDFYIIHLFAPSEKFIKFLQPRCLPEYFHQNAVFGTAVNNLCFLGAAAECGNAGFNFRNHAAVDIAFNDKFLCFFKSHSGKEGAFIAVIGINAFYVGKYQKFFCF